MSTLHNIQEILDNFNNQEIVKLSYNKVLTLRTVYKYDIDGNFIEKYESITKAAISNNCRTAAINDVLQKRHKTFNKHIYLNVYYNKIPQDVLSFYIERKNHKQKGIGIDKKYKIKQYNLNGEFIKFFKNAPEAALEVGTTKRCIYAALKSKSNKTAGFIWKFNND